MLLNMLESISELSLLVLFLVMVTDQFLFHLSIHLGELVI